MLGKGSNPDTFELAFFSCFPSHGGSYLTIVLAKLLNFLFYFILFSLGCHLFHRDTHIFRSWYNRRSSRVQSKDFFFSSLTLPWTNPISLSENRSTAEGRCSPFHSCSKIQQWRDFFGAKLFIFIRYSTAVAHNCRLFVKWISTYLHLVTWLVR